MPFPYDKYPWLNFQELNLAYFIKHFREIFQQWDQLYHDLLDWKDATDAELAEWKSTVEEGISSWETGLTAALEEWKSETESGLETWKHQTESDIGTWEAATLAALEAWKTATTAVFEQIRTEAVASATAAAGSATAAQTALAGAQAAQAAAETAAAGIQSELAQIETNKENISNLQSALNLVLLNLNVSTMWEAGGIVTSSGANSDSAYPPRIRTADYIPASVSRISILSGYRYAIYVYNTSDNSYVGMWNGTEVVTQSSPAWLSEDTDIDHSNAYSYRLTLIKEAYTATYTNEYNNIILYAATDDTLTKAGKAADAKAVGDALTEQANSIRDVAEEVGTIGKTEIRGPSGWTYYRTGYINSDGSIATSEVYSIYYFVASENFNLWTDDNFFHATGNDYNRIYFGLYSGSTFGSDTWTGIRRAQTRNTSDVVTYDDMPKAQSKVTVPSGTYVVVSVGDGASDFRFLADGDNMARYYMGPNVILNSDQIEQVNNSVLKPIVNKTESVVTMYIPTSNKKYYLSSKLSKVDNQETNALGWRFKDINLLKPDKSSVRTLVGNGEWEMALKLRGRTDFIGLGNHGDEIMDMFKLYIDGAEIAENAEFPNREWHEIQLICGLTMYDPSDSSVVVGYHTRIDTINAEKRTVTIANKVQFASTLPPERSGTSPYDIIDANPSKLTMEYGYLFMCPIQRLYNNKQITDTFIDNEDYVLTDCSVADHFVPDAANLGVGKIKNHVTEYKFWGSDFDLYGSVKVLRRVAPDSATPSYHIFDGDAYNKAYLSMCGQGEKVSPNEVWEMETEFFIDSGYSGDA